MVVLCALVLAGTRVTEEPRILGDTPEWKAYRNVLDKAKSYSVLAVLSSNLAEADALGYGVALKKSVSGQIFTQRVAIQSRWNGKRGVGVDVTKKTWWEEEELDCSFPMSLLEAEGNVTPGRKSGDEPVVARLTRSYLKREKHHNEVGWETSWGGRDTSVKVQIWFDPITHLPVEISSLAWGMLGEPGAAISQYIVWSLKAVKDDPQFLTPPAGFVKVKSH